MKNEILAEELADNIFFRMAYQKLSNKRITITVDSLFTEAYRLLNYIEKHKIKIGEK
jgi:hypothetical protein